MRTQLLASSREQWGAAPFAPAPAGATAGVGPLVDEAVIHDLLNPLTGLMGHLQLLQELLHDGSVDMARDRLKGCFESLSSLLSMLFDLQQLMRMETGKAQLERQTVRLAQLISETRRAYDESIDSEGREIIVHCPDGDAQMEGDPQLLQRTMLLLVLVARRLSRTGPLSLQTICAEGWLSIVIGYTGPTLPPTLATELFGPDGAALQKQTGHRIDRGRGLMLVAAVARLHDGSVSYSATSGGGAFTLKLPLHG